MRHYPIQTSFTSGELSPRLEGRVDLAQYSNGCSILENFLILPHGGVTRRGGSFVVEEVKDSTKSTRLIPFEFSTTQAYVLEFGDQYIRVYRDNGQVIEAAAPSVTNGTFETLGAGDPDFFANWAETAGTGEIAVESTDPFWGDYAAHLTAGGSANTNIRSDSIVVAAETKYQLSMRTKGDGSNAGRYAIWDVDNGAWITSPTTTGVTSTTWTKKLFDFETPVGCTHIYIYLYCSTTNNADSYFDQIDLEGYPVEISTPYLEADLFDLYYTQSADVLYITHEGYAPRKLERSSHTSWTLTTIDFNDGPYLDPNVDITKRVTPSGLDGAITLTAEGFTWDDNDPGAHFRLKLNNEWGWVILGSKVSSTVINATVQDGPLPGKDGVVNGDMELATNWGNYNTPTTNEQSGEQYHGGEYSRKFVADAANDGIQSDAFSVAKGQKYFVSVWVYPDTGTTVRMRVLKGGGGSLQYNQDHSGLTQDAWNQITFTYTSTETGSSARLIVAADAVGTWYVDDAKHLHITGTDFWREGCWSLKHGYPRCVTFFEGRLFFSATDDQPQTVWGSASGDFENFSPGTDDDDPVQYTVGSDQVNVIKWMAPSTQLILGTAAAEFKLGGGGSDIVTPSSITVKSPTTFGSARVRPVRVSNAIMFIQRTLKKLRNYEYSLEIDSYKAENMTIFSEHITGDGFIDMAYQQDPDSILWCARYDGVLCGMTYERDHKVLGWHRHITDGEIESVCVIPSSDGSADELWMIVKRSINGNDVRYVEYIDPELNTDCSVYYNGAAATEFSGLDHLEGEEVYIVGDGAVYAPQTVEAGKVTISPAAEYVEFGLPYTSTLRTMRPEVETNLGTSQGRKRRWARVRVRVYQTLGATILDEIIPFRDSQDPMDEGPDLFSGVIQKSNLGWDYDGYIEIVQDQPLPITILQITGTLEVST